MLSNEMLAAVKGYTDTMQKSVTLVIQTGDHPKRAELVAFLRSVASVAEKITLEERDTHGQLRSPISFLLEVEGSATGIQFSGIPSGHEFNSLILALLQSAGSAIKLDKRLTTVVSELTEKLTFEVFVSLSCHNCPDVVQALNQFALLNPNISSEMIDGGLFPDIIAARDIQGVPSVYLNGELFANGKITTAKLIDKLIELYPPSSPTEPAETLPVQDVTVIGGGPSGISAAIYAARKGLKVVLIADIIGGQVKDTMGIENLI